MMMLARAGENEGAWLRADRQSFGRGRQGRSWQSSSGNLFASTLVRLRADDPAAATLAFVTSLALFDTVQAVLTDAAALVLKWPNDLLLAGAKLSGILLEREDDAVVVGIGVNLATHPDDLDRPATSLSVHMPPPPPGDFLDALAERFAQWIAVWRTDGFSKIRSAWLERAHPQGAELAVHDPSGEKMQGSFDGLTEDGALRLRLADGSVRVMHAGDVFLI